MNKFLSVLVSLLFPLTAVIGMLIGQLGSRLFASFANFFSGNMQIGSEFIFFAISGYVAGYFSAFAISKIYKNFNFKFTLIVPVLMMIYFGYENIITSSEVNLSFMINSFVRDVIMLITFYYYLMEYRVSNE
jgi:hypothetical protein